MCIYLNANYWATSRHSAISGKFVKFLVSSVATPPSVRAEWAFKIFDSDEDQLLGERDIRLSVIRHQVLSSIYKGKGSLLQAIKKIIKSQDGGGCNNWDGRDCLQKSWCRKARHCGQECPQVRQISEQRLFEHIFFRETDLNRTGQISLAEFKQMVIRWGARYQDKLSKVVLSDLAPTF